MAAIKAIIFDVGGVLCQGSWQHFVQRCAKLGLKQVEKIKKNDPYGYGKPMQIGERTARQELDRFFGGNVPAEKMNKAIELYAEEWARDEEMIEFVKGLRGKRKLGLLSNTEDVHAARMRKEKLLEMFDAYVLSNEVGLVKPDEGIYLLMLEKLGVKAAESVFFDDVQENVDAAKKLGMQAFRFISREQCESKLKDLGVIE